MTTESTTDLRQVRQEPPVDEPAAAEPVGRGVRSRRWRTDWAPRPAGYGIIGILAVLLGAWGGIVPYVGPVFGYSSNGAGSWVWSLQHAVLYLIPGAAAVFAGLLLLGMVPRSWQGRGRLGGTFAGWLLILCGAWFVLGPFAWPVLHAGSPVFVTTSPATMFAHEVGYNLGTGLLLAVLGAMALKAGVRERPAETVMA